MQKVLISGGSGLVGSMITQKLLQKGYEVSILSRSNKKIPGVSVYQWDPAQNKMDPEALQNVNCIINLAGASVASGRWTDSQKQQIYNSRIDATKTLKKFLLHQEKKPQLFISASAIGYYGYQSKVFTESDPPGQGFLAKVTVDWEEEAFKTREHGVRVAIVRIGVVLSEKDGALPKLVLPIKYYLGAPLGSGQQVISWIHIDDLSNLFIHLFENKIEGIFNAAAPNPVTNKQLTQVAANTIGKKLWLPNVPSFALKLALGEMSQVVLKSQLVDGNKIEETGFNYRFPEINSALQNLLGG